MSEKWFDNGQVTAITNWVLYGLQPGGCSTCIIEGDYDGAYSRAHPHLKNDASFTFQEMYDNLRSIVPPSLLNQPIKSWKGVKEHPEAYEILLFESNMCDNMGWLYRHLQNND